MGKGLLAWWRRRILARGATDTINDTVNNVVGGVGDTVNGLLGK